MRGRCCETAAGWESSCFCSVGLLAIDASTISSSMSSSTGKVACSLGTSLSSRQLVAGVKQLIPALTSARHKGQAGRIGIVGGSRDYTGAPFFASMSSMRLGSDLCYTICSPDAGSVIKTYSPDLIVNRVLNPDVGLGDVESEVDALFARFHAVVIGPGLGRDDFMQSCARLCIKLARKRDLYVVLDADALWLVQNEPDVIKGYSKAVLTPNKAEFARLCNTLGVDADQDPDTAAHKLAIALNGPTILQKGGVDRITNGKEEAHVDAEGSLKRCGGQGDILAGCLGTFAGWAAIYAQEHTVPATASSPGELACDNLLLYAGYGAALTARACSRRAFEKHRRAMLAHDLLAEVGAAYQELWDA